MSEERFEVFGNIIKDNEDIPALLNNYQATVRLNELNNKVKELKEKDNYHLRYELAGADEIIANLRQQLEEKQKTIDEINKEFVQAIHDWKTLCAEKDKEIKKLNWQLKDKDFIIKNLNHSLSVAPNANAGQRARIDELTKIVKEKDKEIEDWKQKTQTFLNRVNEQNYEIANNNPKQLAIQELEKVKELLITENKKYPIVYDITDDLVGGAIDKDKTFEIIDNQINELKKG